MGKGGNISPTNGNYCKKMIFAQLSWFINYESFSQRQEQLLFSDSEGKKIDRNGDKGLVLITLIYSHYKYVIQRDIYYGKRGRERKNHVESRLLHVGYKI